MNTYDTIKRSITQLLNKGIVYEAWGVKCYWVIEEYIHANLVRRYGLHNETMCLNLRPGLPSAPLSIRRASLPQPSSVRVHHSR